MFAMDLSERPSRPSRRHPWEVARFHFFRAVLRDAGADRRPVTILDAGSGDGWFAERLLAGMPAGTRVTCWDASYSAADVAQLTAAASDGIVFASERPRARFGLLLLLDVLEHVERDREFLAELVRENLEDDATAVVSVPAWTGLYGRHDVQLNHHRRYAPAEAAALLQDAGLAIVRRGGLFHSLLLPRYLTKALRWHGRTPARHVLEWRYGAGTGRLVEGVLSLETSLSLLLSRAGLDVPGLSWWAQCRKR
ncbi:MAG: methyltransferase domain-containing protein [Deltaproteobacteria bacterium]|nr:MAG: methyltransferase domain-containing protein [Deltaproteobacteria bacterium]